MIDFRISVLSQDDVESRYDVTYQKGKSYTVHMEHRDLIFSKKNKLYVANMADWFNESELKRARKPLVLSTTIESEELTSKETKLAFKAK